VVLAANGEALAQDVGEYSPDYCMTYTQGVAELVGLENTFKGKDIDDMRRIARDYGSPNVGNLFAILSTMEAQLLDLRVIKYSTERGFAAPLGGDASEYKRCLAGNRPFLHY
jgi:hypothetical protein